MLQIDFVRSAEGVDNEQDRQIQQHVLESILHCLMIVTALSLSCQAGPCTRSAPQASSSPQWCWQGRALHSGGRMENPS
jgi:hypothetical protein